MSITSKKLLTSSAGFAASQAGGGFDVDDVFSTYLYNGTSQTGHTIANGINLNKTITTAGYTSLSLNYYPNNTQEFSTGKIIEDSSGNFYAIITFRNSDNGYEQNTVTKFSSDGSQIWSYRVQDTSSPRYADIDDITFNSAGNIVVVWTPAGQNDYLRINIIDKDTGTILSTANNSSANTTTYNILQSGTNLYWAGAQDGASLYVNSDTSPATEVYSRRVSISSYAQKVMLVPQSDNKPILVSFINDQNSGTSTNGWVFTKLATNLQSQEWSTRHSHSNGSSTQYNSRYMSGGKQYYDAADNMLYIFWRGTNSISGNTSHTNYISKFDMSNGSHVASKSVYFNAASTSNIDARSITKFGDSIICVGSGHNGSGTNHVIMEFDTSLNTIASRAVQLPDFRDRLEIHGGPDGIFYSSADYNNKVEIIKYSEFDITAQVMGVSPTTGVATVTGASLTNTTTGYVNVNPTFNTASDSMNSGSNLTTNTVNLVTSSSVVPRIDEPSLGGMVWAKGRSAARGNNIWDTERNINQVLMPDQGASGVYNESSNEGMVSFNVDGFTLGSNSYSESNYINTEYTSWTFRRAPKFFDVVTYSGNNVNGRQIPHNLGCKPGMIIIKCLSGSYYNTSNWTVYHRSLNSGHALYLNDNSPSTSNNNFKDHSLQTDSVFTVSDERRVNNSQNTYVAYLFAHNDSDGIFGPSANQDIIKCGSYNGSSSGFNVDLGWEPQFVLVKKYDSTGDWAIVDQMRGNSPNYLTYASDNSYQLRPNLTNAENMEYHPQFTSTGFEALAGGGGGGASSSGSYIYVAIRRGPLATPVNGTEVFTTKYRNEVTGKEVGYYTGWPVDTAWIKGTTNSGSWTVRDRKRFDRDLRFNTTAAENLNYTNNFLDNNIGAQSGTQSTQTGIRGYMFRRAPGFFDIVNFNGTSSAQTVSHNLGVIPEMMWVKRRDSTTNGFWHCYHSYNGPTQSMTLSTDNAVLTASTLWNNTSPTSTNFTAGTYWAGNTIAYLFASLDGVSKVGGFSGNNTSNRLIDCGFSNGARLVIVKCTNQAGTQWFLFDSERGITTGNDPYLLLNSDLYEITNLDLIEPHSSGFTVNYNAQEDFNQSGNEYIFYAVA